MKNDRIQFAQKSKRCGAKTRKGTACLSPAMKNGRCRMHGGLSTGAPTREKNGNYKHGFYCRTELERRKEIQKLMNDYDNSIQQSEEFLDDIISKIDDLNQDS